MEERKPKKVLPWIGLGCSVFTLFSYCGPICLISSGIISFISKPENWGTSDNVMIILIGGFVVINILFILGVGAISLYHLLKKRKTG